MFKKFKDKLAEEMKQSPSRLQASMQQLAQAVISPAASNSLIQDITTSTDNLNLTSEETEAATNKFQSIDLQANNWMERSRRSSFSSVTSENFFPSYESPANLYHFQSDMEQSASEFEDSQSSQLEHITKDVLYAAYQKLKTKYAKYRAVYRELYKENMKMKSVLVETQDKALRRISDLKEQCQLEQEAKAHLEEALRNDMEEKDHLINTLNTKIKLLQHSKNSREDLSMPESEGQQGKSNVDLLNDAFTNAHLSPTDNLVSENGLLKEKVKKFEVLLAKCNESLKRNKERISQLTENRDILERDLNILRNSSTERTEMLESEIYNAKHEILLLSEQIGVLKKREEDSALSLAENKLFIHRELEMKEEQNKQLQQDLRKITEYKDILAEAVVKYDHEFKQFHFLMNDQTVELDKKVQQLQNMFTNKTEALKLIQQDIKYKFIGADTELRFKHKEIKQQTEHRTPVQGVFGESIAKNEEVNRSQDELEIQNAQLLGLTTELKSCKSTINDLKEMLREVTLDWEQVKREKECLIANILDYKQILGKLKRDFNSLKADMRQNHFEQETVIDSVHQKIIKIFNSVSVDKKNQQVKSLAESGANEEKKSQDTGENLPLHDPVTSSMELKTIINENNALRKKCEDLVTRNEEMANKVNEFNIINLKNVKLIAEIDGLNFKLRDIAQLQETQDKLQLEMEGLRGKMSNNVVDNNEYFSKEVLNLKDKLNNYDVVIQDNTALKQEAIDLKHELATVMNNMEVLKLEQAKTVELGIESFSQKCAEYENMIVNLTDKFTIQTQQLENLHSELAKQKNGFRELNDKYESRNIEFQEKNNAFEKQASELRELNEKYKTQCSEIEDLRQKETQILNQLDGTVKVREEMITKFNELDACKNDIVDTKNKELDQLKIDLASFTEKKLEFENCKLNEIQVLIKEKAELIKEIDHLKSQIGENEILCQSNAALQLELAELNSNNMEIAKNNKELKEEQNNLVKLNKKLKLSEDHLQQENNELKSNVSKLVKELEDLQMRLDTEVCNIEEQSVDLKKETETARQNVLDMQVQNAELEKAMEILLIQQRDQAASQSEIETSRVLLTAQVNELQLKLEEFSNVCQANSELQVKIENLNSKIQSYDIVDATNVQLRAEIEKLNDRIDVLRTYEIENCNLKIQMEDLRHNITELELNKLESTELRSELERVNESKTDYFTEVQNLREQNEKLAIQAENLQALVNEKTIEFNLLQNSSTALVNQLENFKSDQAKILEDNSETITELSKEAKEFEYKLNEYRHEADAFRITNTELQDQLMKLNSDHSKCLEDKNVRYAELEMTVHELENKLMNNQQQVDTLSVINKELQDKLTKMNSDHSLTVKDNTEKVTALEQTAKDFENKFRVQRQEFDALEIRNKELQDKLAKVNSDYSKALEDKSKRITELEKNAEVIENDLIGSQEEVNSLKAMNKTLQQEAINVEQNDRADNVLMKNYNRLQDENEELRTRLDEATILYDTEESQIEILNQKLQNKTQILSDKLRINEEEHAMRIKQLVKEFQAQIHDKDEQIQAALEKRFERQQNYESDLIQQYKEQLKDFQVELTAKSEQIENLILDNKETIQAYKDQIEELTQTVTEVKKEYTNELQDVEQNWKTILKQRTDQLETKHVDEVNELTKEWWNERKTAENSDTSPGELESTSRVAMATVQSNTGSLHSLQQTLISQKRELSELRKLLRIRNDNLEGSTEIEYLRNILFEYMMGRETLVLTRVISAVVKFDQEQTTKVLKKEEDKLTLLGSLGLL